MASSGKFYTPWHLKRKKKKKNGKRAHRSAEPVFTLMITIQKRCYDLAGAGEIFIYLFYFICLGPGYQFKKKKNLLLLRTHGVKAPAHCTPVSVSKLDAGLTDDSSLSQTFGSESCYHTSSLSQEKYESSLGNGEEADN